MDQAKNWIHCDGAYRLGLTGKHVGVAVLDTGIFLHRDFEDRVVSFSDFVRHRRDPVSYTHLNPPHIVIMAIAGFARPFQSNYMGGRKGV